MSGSFPAAKDLVVHPGSRVGGVHTVDVAMRHERAEVSNEMRKALRKAIVAKLPQGASLVEDVERSPRSLVLFKIVCDTGVMWNKTMKVVRAVIDSFSNMASNYTRRDIRRKERHQNESQMTRLRKHGIIPA